MDYQKKLNVCTSRPFSHFFWQTHENSFALTWKSERGCERAERLKAKPISSIIHFEHRNYRKITPTTTTPREWAKTIFSLIKFVEKKLIRVDMSFTQTITVCVRKPCMFTWESNLKSGWQADTACECMYTPIMLIACRMHQNIKYHLRIFRLSHVFSIFMSLCIWRRQAVKFTFYDALLVCFFLSFFLDWCLVNSKRWFCARRWVTPFKR